MKKALTYKEISAARAMLSMLIGLMLLFLAVGGIFLAMAMYWPAGISWGLFWLCVFGLFGLRWDDMGFELTGRVMRDWSNACKTLGLTVRHEGKLRVPYLRNIEGGSYHWSAHVALWPEQTIDHFRSKEADFSAVLGRPVNFRYVQGGAIEVRAGVERLISEAPELVPIEPRIVETRELTVWDWVTAVPVAKMAGGGLHTISITDNHILIIGASGAGKSTWIWSILMGLRLALQNRVVKLWACDPKLVELNKSRGWFDEYAKGRAEICELVRRFHAAMMGRAMVLSERDDDHYQISENEPLNVLLVDELAFLLTAPSKEQKKEADEMVALFTDILRLGRALGFVLIGASQSIKADAVPMKDDFITRVGLRMMSAQHVDMMLGAGAREAGAECWKIDKDRERGVGYVIDDNGAPVRVAALWYDKTTVQTIGRQLAFDRQRSFIPGPERNTDELTSVPALLPQWEV